MSRSEVRSPGGESAEERFSERSKARTKDFLGRGLVSRMSGVLRSSTNTELIHGEGKGRVLTLGHIAHAIGGRLVGDADIEVSAVLTDSRALEPEALFVALKGPRFDGHDYIDQAFLSGCRGVLVSRLEGTCPAGAGAVVVGDTLQGLQDLAAWHRSGFDSPVVGLTGSSGKTTTKELIAAVLEQTGPTLATEGNLNNHIGVPLTLLRLQQDHSFAVIEMGCSGPGEIDLLASLARPDVAMVTNVGKAHLDGLGDLDGVERAKGELFARLEPSAVAVVNLEDSRVARMPTKAQRRIGFGRGRDAHVRLHGLTATTKGMRLSVSIEGRKVVSPEIALLGVHNALNATAAIAVAHALGIHESAIEQGLSCAKAPKGRLSIQVAPHKGLQVIDDSYNANPASTAAALEALDTAGRQRGAATHVLMGEMLELGSDSVKLHEAAGHLAAHLGIFQVVGVGPAGDAVVRGARQGGLAKERAHGVSTPEDAARLVLASCQQGDVVLVKGSRGAHMERAVNELLGQEDPVAS